MFHFTGEVKHNRKISYKGVTSTKSTKKIIHESAILKKNREQRERIEKATNTILRWSAYFLEKHRLIVRFENEVKIFAEISSSGHSLSIPQKIRLISVCSFLFKSTLQPSWMMTANSIWKQILSENFDPICILSNQTFVSYFIVKHNLSILCNFGRMLKESTDEHTTKDLVIHRQDSVLTIKQTLEIMFNLPLELFQHFMLTFSHLKFFVSVFSFISALERYKCQEKASDVLEESFELLMSPLIHLYLRNDLFPTFSKNVENVKTEFFHQLIEFVNLPICNSFSICEKIISRMSFTQWIPQSYESYSYIDTLDQSYLPSLIHLFGHFSTSFIKNQIASLQDISIESSHNESSQKIQAVLSEQLSLLQFFAKCLFKIVSKIDVVRNSEIKDVVESVLVDTSHQYFSDLILSLTQIEESLSVMFAFPLRLLIKTNPFECDKQIRSFFQVISVILYSIRIISPSNFSHPLFISSIGFTDAVIKDLWIYCMSVFESISSSFSGPNVMYILSYCDSLEGKLCLKHSWLLSQSMHEKMVEWLSNMHFFSLIMFCYLTDAIGFSQLGYLKDPKLYQTHLHILPGPQNSHNLHALENFTSGPVNAAFLKDISNIFRNFNEILCYSYVINKDKDIISTKSNEKSISMLISSLYNSRIQRTLRDEISLPLIYILTSIRSTSRILRQLYEVNMSMEFDSVDSWFVGSDENNYDILNCLYLPLLIKYKQMSNGHMSDDIEDCYNRREGWEYVKLLPHSINVETRYYIVHFNNIWLRRYHIHTGKMLSHMAVREHTFQNAFEAFINPLDVRFSDIKHVRFENEYGEGDESMMREFINILIKDMFSLETGLFVNSPSGWLVPKQFDYSKTDRKTLNLKYKFVGKALLEACLLNCIPKLPISPILVSSLIHENTPQKSIMNLRWFDQELQKNLVSLLNMSDDALKELCLTFTVFDTDGKSVKLKPNGNQNFVNSHNVHEYVYLYSRYYTYTQTANQYDFLHYGFMDSEVAFSCKYFEVSELQSMFCNFACEFDVEDMISNIEFSDFGDEREQKEFFIQYLRECTQIELSNLFLFWTGMTCVPLGGFSLLYPRLRLTHNDESDRYPSASICINMLVLPHCSSVSDVRQKINYSLEHNYGFGLV